MAEAARIASRKFWNGSDAARFPSPHDSFATVAHLREMWG